MIRPYAAFNVLPTEIAESGRSRTKLLPAANAIADCLVLSVIANATVVWLEGESRTRSRIVLLCSPILRSTTTVSNFRVFTRRMALGISVHTSVVAANSRSGSEICLMVNGSSETSSARTEDSAEPRVALIVSLRQSVRLYWIIVSPNANSGGIFRGCSENRKRRLLAFNQNCFAERAPTGQPQSRRAHSCAVNSRYGIRKTARKKYRVILGSAFCSDFETRLPPSRMHSSLTAIHQSSWVRSQMFCCCSEY